MGADEDAVRALEKLGDGFDFGLRDPWFIDTEGVAEIPLRDDGEIGEEAVGGERLIGEAVLEYGGDVQHCLFNLRRLCALG